MQSRLVKELTLQCVSYLQGAKRQLRNWPTVQVAAGGNSRKGTPPKTAGDLVAKVKRSNRKMKLTIAVEGCCHGELDKIYATLQHLEQRENKKIDLLICCGDFQAVRNLDDLETLACPPKYRAMQTFYRYYSGEKTAPIPTVFIGGNHEAANHLWELYYGGWAAPNIYFLGFSGSVRFGGLRIAGLSGIYKGHDYRRGHHEALPYTDSTIRSLYHVRDFEVYRLLQLQTPVDIFVSHDWPTDIARYGNMQQLLARKPFLRSELESGTLGSPPGATLLAALKPAYWFAAHMHVKFAAVVQHSKQGGLVTSSPSAAAARQQQQQPQSTAMEASAEGSGGQGGGSGTPPGGFPSTRFLALDKCLPGRDFLQLIELDAPGPPVLQYDEEWLAVLRSTHNLTNLAFQHAPLPGMGMLRSGPRPEDVQFVRQALEARGGAVIPNNFAATAKPYDPVRDAGRRKGRMPQRHERNPQTVALLDLIGVPYNLDHSNPSSSSAACGKVVSEAAAAVAGGGGGSGRPSGRAPLSLTPQGPVTARPRSAVPPPAAAPLPPNPEEIDLGDLDGEEEEAERQHGQGQTEKQGQGPHEGSRASKAVDLASDPMFQPLQL